MNQVPAQAMSIFGWNKMLTHEISPPKMSYIGSGTTSNREFRGFESDERQTATTAFQETRTQRRPPIWLPMPERQLNGRRYLVKKNPQVQLSPDLHSESDPSRELTAPTGRFNALLQPQTPSQKAGRPQAGRRAGNQTSLRAHLTTAAERNIPARLPVESAFSASSRRLKCRPKTVSCSNDSSASARSGQFIAAEKIRAPPCSPRGS